MKKVVIVTSNGQVYATQTVPAGQAEECARQTRYSYALEISRFGWRVEIA